MAKVLVILVATLRKLCPNGLNFFLFQYNLTAADTNERLINMAWNRLEYDFSVTMGTKEKI